jgi:hypothetical protein
VRKNRACDTQRLATFCRERIAEDLHKCVDSKTLAILGNKWCVRIWDERGNHRNVAEQMLNPRQLELDRVLWEVIEHVLEESLAARCAQPRNDVRIGPNAPERRLEPKFGDGHTVAEAKVVVSEDDDAIRAGTLRDRAVARRVNWRAALIVEMAGDNASDFFFDARVLRFIDSDT